MIVNLALYYIRGILIQLVIYSFVHILLFEFIRNEKNTNTSIKVDISKLLKRAGNNV